MENRRELSTRKIGFFHEFAKFLVKLGLSPNQISILSIAFALVGFLGFYHLGTQADNKILWWFLAFAGVQMRLLCNMMDGLMAIEGGMKSASGEIYNDFPDRLSDILLIFPLYFMVPYPWAKDLAWLACVLAVMTAYTRLLGASLNKGHDYAGPMAKQHRMFIVNLGLIAWLFEYYITHTSYAFAACLWVICIGSTFTVINRLYRLTKKL